MRCLASLRYLLVCIVGLVASVAAAAGATVHVYNWSDYIAPSVLTQFQKETGIKVVYDVYDSNEMLEAKLLTGGSGYDVVFPTARPFAQRHMLRNIYMRMDPKALPNQRNDAYEQMAE